MKDHRRVEKILAEAGRCSHGESMYEAGPQAVTQVRTPRIVILLALIINLMVGVNTFEYGPIELQPDFLTLRICAVAVLGSIQVSK